MKIEYDGVIYDSQEEIDFRHWLDEAYEAGLISGYTKMQKGVDSFELIPKQFGKDKNFLYHSVVYTPDYSIDSCSIDGLFNKVDQEKIIVDVKGGGSKFHDKKQFQLIRKMMYYFHKVYVYPVIPAELFLNTWVPEKYRYTPKKGDIKKKFRSTPTINEHIKRGSYEGCNTLRAKGANRRRKSRQ